MGVLSVLNIVRFAMGQCVDQGLGLGFDAMGIATMDTNRTLERDKLILLESPTKPLPDTAVERHQTSDRLDQSHD